MLIKDKLISTLNWFLVVIRVFLSLIAIFILHPLVIGGVIYTALLFLVVDNVSLEGLKAWSEIDNKWFAPKLFEELTAIYGPLFTDHPAAAWIGSILIVFIWIAMWVSLGYMTKRLVKANILRLKGWNNGVIVHNTREITKDSFTFEGFSYLANELTSLLRDRKLVEVTKNKDGKKQVREIPYTIEKDLLGEYVIKFSDVNMENGFGKYTFKNPETEFNIQMDRYKEALDNWREEVKVWKQFKIKSKPIRPIHPRLLTNIKLFGEIEKKDFDQFDYDVLPQDKKQLKEAVKLAKWFVAQFNDRLSRSKVALSEVHDPEIAKEIVETKLKIEDNIKLWKLNLSKAKDYKKSLKNK